MRGSSHLLALLCAMALYGLVAPDPALAYLDPGTGSYLIQLLTAGVLGAFFALKLYWSKLQAFFLNFISKKSKHDD